MVSYMESSRHIKQSILSVDAAQLNRFRGNVGLIPNCRLWLIPKKDISHTVQFSHSKEEQNKHFSYRKTILHQTSSKLWIRPLTYHDYVVQLFWGDTKVSPV